MGASAGEDWDSFIDRMCSLEAQNAELLQKVQQLEAENAELRERLRWRDVKKEPLEKAPPQTIPCGMVIANIRNKTKKIKGFTALLTGRVINSNGDVEWGRDIPGLRGKDSWLEIYSWRPLDLPGEVK